MNVLDYVKAFNEFLWNSFLMYALLGVGIFYTVYLGFPQIRHLNLAFKYALVQYSRSESLVKQKLIHSKH